MTQRRAARAALGLAAVACLALLGWLIFGASTAANRSPEDLAAEQVPSLAPTRERGATALSAPASTSHKRETSEASATGLETHPHAAAPAPLAIIPQEPPVSLRAVGGLVRDATTHAPIAGAWLTWKLPPPHVAAWVFDEGIHKVEGPGVTMVTDPAGRFVLPRLPDDAPRSHVVFAVAPGYAYAATAVGLEREIVIDLHAAGALEIELTGSPRPPAPRLRLTREKAPEAADLVVGGLPAWHEDPLSTVFHVGFLPPGTYHLALDGRAAGSAEVTAGETSYVQLTRAGLEPIAAAVTGPSGPLTNADLILVGTDSLDRFEARTDDSGHLAAELPRGGYVAYVIDGLSERILSGQPSATDPADLSLAGRGDPVRFAVRLDGQPLPGDDLGLVRLDTRFPDLIHLPLEEPGIFAGHAPKGPYALFYGPQLLARVDLDGPHASSLDLQRSTLSVRWLLPDELGADERLRGEVALVPAFVARNAYLRARFLGASATPFRAGRHEAPLQLEVIAEGNYFAVGESDLGPFEVPVPVRGPGAIEVHLGGQ